MNSPKEQDCVLLTLTKDNKIERVRHCTHSDDKLRDYFDAIIAKFKNDFYAMKDIWVLKMVFTDKSRIPDIAIMDQYETLQKLLRNPQLYGIKEHKAFLVHDLDFCSLHGFDPLSYEGAHEKIAKRIGVYAYTDDFRAIRTDRGVHVFTSDETGDHAIENCLSYYEGHFFSTKRGTDRFDLITVRPIDQIPQGILNPFADTVDWNTASLDLPDDFFCKGVTMLELTEKKIDMLPTVSNYWSFSHENEISDISSSTDVYDYCCLIGICEGDIQRPDMIEGEWYESFSLENRFDDLLEELDDCDDNIEREDVSSRIKQLAAKILTEEFADFRYCREPEKIEEQLQQIQTLETEDFQENSNKPKMKI